MGWEKFWLGRIRKRASPAENSEKKLRNSIACENSISRALGPCTLHKKHTQNAKINLSRPPRMGVDRGCGPHIQPPAEKAQIYLTLCGWEGWVGLFGLTSQLWFRSESVPISPFFPTMFFWACRTHMLAGAQGTFYLFRPIVKIESFSVFFVLLKKHEPHSCS